MNDPSPSAPAPSITAAPPRNVVYGVIVGMISAVITSIAKHYLGDLMLPELVAGIPTIVGFAVAYLIPLTQQEVADRTNNQTVKMANADKQNPTTAKVVGEPESDQVAAKDAAAGALDPTTIDKMHPEVVAAAKAGAA